MPLIHMHYPQGAFSQRALNDFADELITTALNCENLPNTPFMRSTAWIYVNEYAPEKVFVGGRPGGTKVITLEILVFEGGLSDTAKHNLIERATALVGRFGGYQATVRVPVYIVIREVAASDWGVFGSRITLASLRTPPADAISL